MFRSRKTACWPEALFWIKYSSLPPWFLLEITTGFCLGRYFITRPQSWTSSNNDDLAGLVSRTLWHVTRTRFLTTEYRYSKLSLLYPILNNYLKQTMDNNVRSGVNLCFLFGSGFQTEVSFILIFPTVLRMEKPCVVLKILDQRTDYVNRSSNRLRVMNCFDRSRHK